MRIPKEWGRHCFHRCLPVHTREGGLPPSSLTGWYHFPVWLGGGVLPCSLMGAVKVPRPDWWGRGFDHPSINRGYPISGWGYPGVPDPVRLDGGTPDQAGWGYPPLGDRAAQRVRATRQGVCFLRSRSRTFLFQINFRIRFDPLLKDFLKR